MEKRKRRYVEVNTWGRERRGREEKEEEKGRVREWTGRRGREGKGAGGRDYVKESVER